MRTTVLGSLLDVAQHNLAHGADRLALFESARVYLKTPPTGLKYAYMVENRPVGGVGGFFGERAAPDYEPHRIGCLAAGSLAPKSWRDEGQPAEFFALKGVLEALAGQLGAVLSFEPGEEPFLHPGRATRVAVAGEPAGWLGEVHPLVCRAWDIDAAVAFEIDLAALVGVASAGGETYEDVTGFPAVNQDIAVVVSADVAAEQVQDAVRAGGGELLRSAEVFDLYEGEQVGEGRKSLALRLEFQAPDRTLTDEEVGGLRTAIEAELRKIGGTPRG